MRAVPQHDHPLLSALCQGWSADSAPAAGRELPHLIQAANGTPETVCTSLSRSLSISPFIDYYTHRARNRSSRLSSNLASGFNHSFNCAAHISAPGEGYTLRSSQHLSHPPAHPPFSPDIEDNILANRVPACLLKKRVFCNAPMQSKTCMTGGFRQALQ